MATEKQTKRIRTHRGERSIGLLILLAASLPSQSWAGPKHWVKTHKLPIAATAASFTVQSLNAVTTIQAEERDPRGVDLGFFGPHPSHAQVWIGTELFAASMTALNLLAYHYAPEPERKVGQGFAVALFTIPLVVSGAADIQDNVDTPRAAARRRVTR